LSIVRQQALTVVAPITSGNERAADQWLRDNRRDLQRALSRSTTTHFARWVLLPPTLDEAGSSVGQAHLLAFETNFDGELQEHVADLRASLGPLLDGAFAHVEGYPGAENLGELAEFFRSRSLRAAAFYIAHGGLSVPVVHGDAAIKRAVEDRLRALSQGARVEGQDALQLAQELQRHRRVLFHRPARQLRRAHRPPAERGRDRHRGVPRAGAALRVLVSELARAGRVSREVGGEEAWEEGETGGPTGARRGSMGAARQDEFVVPAPAK